MEQGGKAKVAALCLAVFENEGFMFLGKRVANCGMLEGLRYAQGTAQFFFRVYTASLAFLQLKQAYPFSISRCPPPPA